MSADPWVWMRWAREQATARELSPIQAHALLALASYADLGTGECFASRKKIAGDLRRGERETSRALSVLVRLGLIERRGRGPGRSSITRLTRGAPHTHDARPTAHQAEDVRPTAQRDVRPTTPNTCGEPPAEQPPNDHKEQQPPRRPPQGGRSRDHREYAQDFAAWAEGNFPGVNVGYVHHAVRRVGRARPDQDLDMGLVRQEVEKWAV